MATRILKKTKEIQSIESVLDCLADHFSRLNEAQIFSIRTLVICMADQPRGYLKTAGAQLLLEMANDQKTPAPNVVSLAVARGLKKQSQFS